MIGRKGLLTCYVYFDHARDQITRRSVTGIDILLNNTSIFWLSKRQSTVETSTYRLELVASRSAVELLVSMRYSLRIRGVNVEETSVLGGDIMSVILNITIPSSVMKKKHQAINYHKVKECIVAGFIVWSYRF